MYTCIQWNPSIKTPLNEDISFNQDTMHGPCYIEQCYSTKLPLKWEHLL